MVFMILKLTFKIKKTMIKIEKAIYGTLDVTNVLKKLLKDNEYPIFANNANFTDPMVNVVKTLIIEYTENGEKKQLNVLENNVIPNEFLLKISKYKPSSEKLAANFSEQKPCGCGK